MDAAPACRCMSELIGLRDDVYRRPLATALERLGLEAGWTCVDVGAGGGDVSVALAGWWAGTAGCTPSTATRSPATGGPRRRRGGRRPGHRPDAGRGGPAPARTGRSGLLPLPPPPCARPRRGRAPDGGGGQARWVGGGPGADHLGRAHRRRGPCPCPTPAIEDIGALLPALVRDAGLEVIDAWGESPAGVGPGTGGPVSRIPDRSRSG